MGLLCVLPAPENKKPKKKHRGDPKREANLKFIYLNLKCPKTAPTAATD
jgi:hypothetical protein